METLSPAADHTGTVPSELLQNGHMVSVSREPRQNDLGAPVSVEQPLADRRVTASREPPQYLDRRRSWLTEDIPDDDDDDDAIIIPILPLELAVVCCVTNFVLPGVGTMIAGFSVLCCAKTDDITPKQKYSSAIVVVAIGFLQLIMVSCFLIGWIWSGIWGVSLIGNSAEYYKESESSNWRGDNRRRLRPRSNLIYPMRARSNIRYHSPPPPYEMYRTPPPGYSMPGQTVDQEETEIPAEPEPDRNLDMVEENIIRNEVNNPQPQFWQCAVCQKQNNASERKFQCNRCMETVCDSCYQQHFTMPNGERIVVCDTCYNELSLPSVT
ncbi:uncharacterized protein LOC133187637 [Saccostrea echinata]|uniref:uncharacterized protein LOC133187637 n=1 Tax=Saccostrea echinata TaxID=191078 RepID=UPI002A7FF599|nr:uncharacterized protein LOC133187637 [Saccostrea echinata]